MIIGTDVTVEEFNATLQKVKTLHGMPCTAATRERQRKKVGPIPGRLLRIPLSGIEVYAAKDSKYGPHLFEVFGEHKNTMFIDKSGAVVIDCADTEYAEKIFACGMISAVHRQHFP